MRQDDHEKKCYFRSSDRVFRLNGAWYFTTREGDEGPFPTEAHAQREVERFINSMIELAKFRASREAEKETAELPQPTVFELVELDARPRIRSVEKPRSKAPVHI